MLRNDESADLTVAQIAAHLRTHPWNITRQLKLGAQGEPGRLTGTRTGGIGSGSGRGGQWRVDRLTYYRWLGLVHEDLTHLGPDGLPELLTLDQAARQEQMDALLLRVLIQQRLRHIVVGRQTYLTHCQYQRLKQLLAQDCRDLSR